MALKLFALAGLAGLSMCATTPEPVVEDTAQTGPDGLIIRSAPSESVETGALPLPAPAAEDSGVVETN